jgi:hypothetical protein
VTGERDTEKTSDGGYIQRLPVQVLNDVGQDANQSDDDLNGGVDDANGTDAEGIFHDGSITTTHQL